MSLSKSSTSDIVKKYGSNDKDTGSTAVQIALLSKRIEDLQKHLVWKQVKLLDKQQHQ
jgi:small subunit ribosomal protein S15